MIIIALNLVKQLECHGVTLFLELRKLLWTESTFLTSSQVRVNSLLIGLVKPSTAIAYTSAWRLRPIGRRLAVQCRTKNSEHVLRV